ncbi:MAG TPA: hypothetical protein VHN79_11225 [Lacunisphaera sp.]|nr:hypothetical protein [Lacunisphaera sp.]
MQRDAIDKRKEKGDGRMDCGRGFWVKGEAGTIGALQRGRGAKAKAALPDSVRLEPDGDFDRPGRSSQRRRHPREMWHRLIDVEAFLNRAAGDTVAQLHNPQRQFSAPLRA